MKKIILFSIVLSAFTINAKAQITLVHTYDSAGFYAGQYAGVTNREQLEVVKLEVDGDKFVFIDDYNKLIRFYNLNHTPWKTISFATATDLSSTYNVQPIMYISQHLFNTDDKIEFLYVDNNLAGTASTITQVLNEDGTILFTANNQAPFLNASVPQAEVPIYNTSAGTFMILSGGIDTDINAYVYGLGGTLAAGIKGYSNNAQNILMASMAYPNPTRSSTKIDYTLPNGINKGEIVFYDTQGKEVKRFNVDNTFNTLMISTEDLQSGLYYYNLQTTQGISEAKK